MIFSSKQGLRRLWWHARQSVNNDNRKIAQGLKQQQTIEARVPDGQEDAVAPNSERRPCESNSAVNEGILCAVGHQPVFPAKASSIQGRSETELDCCTLVADLPRSVLALFCRVLKAVLKVYYICLVTVLHHATTMIQLKVRKQCMRK